MIFALKYYASGSGCDGVKFTVTLRSSQNFGLSVGEKLGREVWSWFSTQTPKYFEQGKDLKKSN